MRFNIKNVQICFAEKKDFNEINNLLKGITTAIKGKDGWSNYKTDSKTTEQQKTYIKILASESKLFTAVYKGAIVGLVNMQLVLNIRHGWTRAHLEEVVVHPDFRKKGIGSLLIKFIKNYCHQHNIKVIKLMCGKQLSDAMVFYKKNGFVCKDEGLRCELD